MDNASENRGSRVHALRANVEDRSPCSARQVSGVHGRSPARVNRLFLHLEGAEAIGRNQSATSEGARRLWALLSQDEVLAAHELSSSNEEQAAHAARLQRAVQSVGEAPAAHELQSA
jgi:hypothetical protein